MWLIYLKVPLQDLAECVNVYLSWGVLSILNPVQIQAHTLRQKYLLVFEFKQEVPAPGFLSR